jgi:multiple sugar transport system substrate-binding protein/putative aldouronate transport system substrate-binding protein
MDPALVVSPLTNGYNDISELAVEGNEFFTENCIDAPASPACDAWTDYSGDIIQARKDMIASVVRTDKPVDIETAMATYVESVGDYVTQVLEELNAQ